MKQFLHHTRMITARPADGARMLALALVYVLAARLGLALDAVSGFATLVWPASGISLAALTLFGYRLWPGVLIGAVVANLLVGAPVPVALGIGVGNTLEAIVGVYLLRRIPDFRTSLTRVRDVLALIVGAAGISTLVSATIGTTALAAAGMIAAGNVMETWQAWWIGDAMGDLLVAPLILVWATGPNGTLMGGGRRLLEVAALAVSTFAVGYFTFLRPGVAPGASSPYMLFPVGIWAALRFGPRGAVTTVFFASAGAIWGTATQRGPFVRAELHESLLALQLFTSIVAVTFLVLAASIAERRLAEADALNAHAEADEANRAKSEFLAVMSHELRTPLHAISGYAELLTMGAQGPLNEGQLDSLSRIQRNQRHLHSLITDILSFARLEAGKLAVTPVEMKAIAMFDAVDPLIQPDLLRKRLRFERHACPPDLRVIADPEKLEQILLNFLTNAVKYTEPGGSVAMGVAARDGRATFWVQDSGIGIPPDQLARVFEPFFQVERGRTRRYSGVGLGLTIARDLARAMRGDVLIESTPGQGTRASVVLPTA